MPRTRAAKKKNTSQSAIPIKFALDVKQKLADDKTDMNMFLLKVKHQLVHSKLSLPKSALNKTIRELCDLPSNWSGDITSASLLHDVTKTASTRKNKTIRNCLVGDDEDSSKSTTSDGRTSRTRSRSVLKPTRLSRSASAPGKPADKYKTPKLKNPPMSYGVVTPKVNPKTPQVILRRPQVGEMALSLQGSPLSTGVVTTDHIANINIPLDDGRVLTIQPERGLRMSQIPTLDLETQTQLQTLRDNLSKLCDFTRKH